MKRQGIFIGLIGLLLIVFLAGGVYFAVTKQQPNDDILGVQASPTDDPRP